MMEGILVVDVLPSLTIPLSSLPSQKKKGNTGGKNQCTKITESQCNIGRNKIYLQQQHRRCREEEKEVYSCKFLTLYRKWDNNIDCDELRMHI